jgi:hypothetical protein
MTVSLSKASRSLAHEDVPAQLTAPISTPGGYVTYYYCCNCGMGPWSEELYTGCQNCFHNFCTRCPLSTYSKHSEHRHESGQQDIGGAPAIQQQPSTQSSDNASIGFRGSVEELEQSPHRASASPSQHVMSYMNGSYGDPADDGVCQSLPAAFLTTTPEYTTGDSTTGASDGGEIVWFCSNCGSGPMLLDTTPCCISCNHWRCQDCKCEYT